MLPGPAHAGNYYVDASGGDDNATGTSPALAWKSLVKANAVALQPGDSLLFKSGGMWQGQLHPKGSGLPGKPITIAAYGGIQKAIVNGNGLIGEGTLFLEGQSYWDIGGLELTNDAKDQADRRGVNVIGPANQVRLHDLYVHHVAGIRSDPTLSNGDPVNIRAKSTGGIGIYGGGEDITVEDCEVFHVDNCGIFTEEKGGAYVRLRLRNNVLHDIAKNAIIIRGTDEKSVIEHNVCYQTCVRGVTTGNTIFSAHCQGTVFQYNEGYLSLSSGPFDGSLYDVDINGNTNTKWQYSYSHDNNYGLIWFASTATDTGIKVRYNVSQNDRGRIFCLSYDLGHADIYNNTIYIGKDVNPVILYEGSRKYDYGFYNNIIYNLSQGAAYKFSGGKRKVDYNVFYGNHPSTEPADAHKLTGDPLFVSPGAGKIGLASISGYRLMANSPCINSGMNLKDDGGLDINADKLLGVADRGAMEWQGVVALAEKPALRGSDRNPAHANNRGKWTRLFLTEAAAEADALGRR